MRSEAILYDFVRQYVRSVGTEEREKMLYVTLNWAGSKLFGLHTLSRRSGHVNAVAQEVLGRLRHIPALHELYYPLVTQLLLAHILQLYIDAAGSDPKENYYKVVAQPSHYLRYGTAVG